MRCGRQRHPSGAAGSASAAAFGARIRGGALDGSGLTVSGANQPTERQVCAGSDRGDRPAHLGMFVETIVLHRREWARFGRSACGSRDDPPEAAGRLCPSTCAPVRGCHSTRRSRVLIRWSWSGLKLSDRCGGGVAAATARSMPGSLRGKRRHQPGSEPVDAQRRHLPVRKIVEGRIGHRDLLATRRNTGEVTRLSADEDTSAAAVPSPMTKFVTSGRASKVCSCSSTIAPTTSSRPSIRWPTSTSSKTTSSLKYGAMSAGPPTRRSRCP